MAGFTRPGLPHGELSGAGLRGEEWAAGRRGARAAALGRPQLRDGAVVRASRDPVSHGETVLSGESIDRAQGGLECELAAGRP